MATVDLAATHTETNHAADALFLLIGAAPFTGWLPHGIQRDERGFIVTGADVDPEAWPLDREPFPLETTMPGVFAGRDTRHRSVKRVASAVGEGSIAVQFVHQYFASVHRTPRGRCAAVREVADVTDVATAQSADA